jgi:hypothetical protein
MCRQFVAVARKRVRIAAAQFAAGTLTPQEWSESVTAAVVPGVASIARLMGGGGQFSLGTQCDVENRVRRTRELVRQLAEQLAAGADPLELPLAVPNVIRQTHNTYCRRAAIFAGMEWECRMPGPACPRACYRSVVGRWRPLGEVPAPSETPGCQCHLEFAAGDRPADRDPQPPVRFTDDPQNRLDIPSPELAPHTSPSDAEQILSECDDLDEDTAAGLEGAAERGWYKEGYGAAFKPAFPPNPSGNHFSADHPAGHALLPYLVAAVDVSMCDPLEMAESLVTEAEFAGASSFAAYSQGGGFGRGRQQMHDRLTHFGPYAPATPSPQPTAMIVVGPSASCKSGIMCGRLRDQVGDRYTTELWWHIDADKIARELPEFQGWNRPLLMQEAGHIAAATMHKCVAGRVSFMLEYHGCEPFSAAALADHLSRSGYEVHACGVEITPAENRKRCDARFRENPFGSKRPDDPAPFVSDAETSRDYANIARQLKSHPALSSWVNHDALLRVIG